MPTGESPAESKKPVKVKQNLTWHLSTIWRIFSFRSLCQLSGNHSSDPKTLCPSLCRVHTQTEGSEPPCAHRCSRLLANLGHADGVGGDRHQILHAHALTSYSDTSYTG